MATRGSKPRFVLIIVLPLLLSLMCQEIVATGRLRSKKEGCVSTGIACHVKVTGSHDPLEMDEYDQAFVSPPHDDYDFYRKHGDIPSPGVGH